MHYIQENLKVKIVATFKLACPSMLLFQSWIVAEAWAESCVDNPGKILITSSLNPKPSLGFNMTNPNRLRLLNNVSS